jgi:hypothetical protein
MKNMFYQQQYYLFNNFINGFKTKSQNKMFWLLVSPQLDSSPFRPYMVKCPATSERFGRGINSISKKRSDFPTFLHSDKYFIHFLALFMVNADYIIGCSAHFLYNKALLKVIVDFLAC